VEALGNLKQIVQLVGLAADITIDRSLARGLSYYTGAIMEISVHDLPGSLGGGGRYDNLIGMFSGTDIPACGFSLGLERILVVMDERGMFPSQVEQFSIDVVVAALEEGALSAAMNTATELRRSGDLRVDLYPDVARKMDKIFKYVDQRNAKFIAILGSDEVANGTVTLRNVKARTKEVVSRAEAPAFIKLALTVSN
jgi:histidyl-tRNA synthetase